MTADENKFSFEHALEADMDRLSKELSEVKNRPEFREAQPREIVKESLNAFKPSSVRPVPPSAKTGKNDDSVLPSYMAVQTPQTKYALEELIGLSLKDGFGKAFDAAAKQGGFMVDALHDTLAEKLVPELERRGLMR